MGAVRGFHSFVPFNKCQMRAHTHAHTRTHIHTCTHAHMQGCCQSLSPVLTCTAAQSCGHQQCDSCLHLDLTLSVPCSSTEVTQVRMCPLLGNTPLLYKSGPWFLRSHMTTISCGVHFLCLLILVDCHRLIHTECVIPFVCRS